MARIACGQPNAMGISGLIPFDTFCR